MSNDRAKHNIVPPSRFGVVEITRQRVRPVTEIKTAEGCPCCSGTGEIQASISYSDEIEAKFKYLLEEKKLKKFTFRAHPFIAAYFQNSIFGKSFKMRIKYSAKIKIEPMDRFNMLQYDFIDKNENNIEI